MEIEKMIQILIYTHAFFGGIALLSGLVSIISKKGNKIHTKSGMIFYYSMLFSALTALIISVLPKHESPFLFSIGIFSSYFVLTGKRALNFKTDNENLIIDKIISWAMLFTGLVMILYNPIFNNKINLILTVYGLVGLIFSIRDLDLYKDREKLKNDWLKIHLGKMIGGYISATTAFVVVNNFFPSIYGWFIPGIFGGIYISYWMMKLNKKTYN
jgi:uncharacterized membrane protein